MIQNLRSTIRRRIALLLTSMMLLAMVLPLGGCPRTRDFTTIADELRRDNMELQRQVEQLQRELDLRLGQIDTLQQQLDEPTVIEDADVPRFSAVAIGRYSGIIDTTGDGIDDTLRLYVRPLDQHGRFLTSTGRAEIQAVALPDVAEPLVLAQRRFEPAEFDAAYRSGITGTHYTLQAPLTTPVPTDIQNVTVRIRFTDARTGASATAQSVVPAHRPRPSPRR